MNRIYYFTGTGNSLYLAKNIQKGIGDAELISIADVISSQERIVIHGGRIGFVFPVYFARIPVVVQKFMERIDHIQADYVFSIITGGGLFGSVLKVFNRMLAEKNSQLDAGFLVKMPSNHPKIAQLQKQPNHKMIELAASQMEKITATVEREEHHDLVASPKRIGGFITRFAFKELYMKSQLGELDKVFSTDESCDACGLCVKYCPVNNISLDRGCVKWLHHCANCARCYHICPQGAIRFGADSMERYMNPFIEIEELVKMS